MFGLSGKRREQNGGADQTAPDEGSDEEFSADSDENEPVSESEEQQQDEGWWLTQYMEIIHDHTYTAATNSRHHYINFQILGQTLSTELIMGHLEQILSKYSKAGVKLYVQPQLGFFLYNQSKQEITKYFYASANTGLFKNYRTLSFASIKRMENYIRSLSIKDFPFEVKSNAKEKSGVGFTLITNIVYSLLVV